MCTFSSEFRCKVFLKGIELCILQGHSCPTRTCRFIEYEDLPLYSHVSESLEVSTNHWEMLNWQKIPEYFEKLWYRKDPECWDKVAVGYLGSWVWWGYSCTHWELQAMVWLWCLNISLTILRPGIEKYFASNPYNDSLKMTSSIDFVNFASGLS